MSYELCRHIMTNGKRCQSPALKNENWCYFHNRLHTGHRAVRASKPAPVPSSPPPLVLPALEDREAIQVGISLVVEAVAIGTLDPRRAGVLLRGLQIASRNSEHLMTEPYAPNVVRSFIPTEDGLPLAERQMDDYSNATRRIRTAAICEDLLQSAIS